MSFVRYGSSCYRCTVSASGVGFTNLTFLSSKSEGSLEALSSHNCPLLSSCQLSIRPRGLEKGQACNMIASGAVSVHSGGARMAGTKILNPGTRELSSASRKSRPQLSDTLANTLT